MQDLIARTEQAESYFFSRATLRFFYSRVLGASLTRLDDDTFRFVTSERYDYTTPRLYTVREARFYRVTLEDGTEVERVTFDSIGGFQAYPSAASARRHLLDLTPVQV